MDGNLNDNGWMDEWIKQIDMDDRQTEQQIEQWMNGWGDGNHNDNNDDE